MSRLTPECLATMTLRRQFPSRSSLARGGRGSAAVLDLFRRLGPIQSQVPRAPFLTASSRLPGVEYETVRAAFADHLLVKTSNIRGTVHTSIRQHFGWLDAVATRARAGSFRNHLKLATLTPADVTAEIESFCADEWRPRTEIVEHLREWLADKESQASADAIVGMGVESLLWGHSGMLRRPKDTAWEKRTDIFHRTARSVITDGSIPTVDPDAAIMELVRVHLGSYGPATRRDIAWWLGDGLTRVDAAVDRLGDEITRTTGADRLTYLDLAVPPTGGTADPGLRLLPEFDGLFLGFAPESRGRFVSPDHLDRLWAKVNGLFSPIVLHESRIVASWKTIAQGKRTDLEVTMLPGHKPIPDDAFTEQIAHVETVLPIKITELRVRQPDSRDPA